MKDVYRMKCKYEIRKSMLRSSQLLAVALRSFALLKCAPDDRPNNRLSTTTVLPQQHHKASSFS